MMKSRWFILILFIAVFTEIKEASAQKTEHNIEVKKSYKIENPVGVPDTTSFYFQPDNLKGRTQIAYPYAAVDSEPTFSGGENLFVSSYLNKKIHVAPGTKGRVIISFIVDKDGFLTNFNILRGVNAEANRQVIDVLKKSPKWIPGKKKGKAVNVQYIMPVNLEK